jgi:hypothetical protein
MRSIVIGTASVRECRQLREEQLSRNNVSIVETINEVGGEWGLGYYLGDGIAAAIGVLDLFD